MCITFYENFPRLTSLRLSHYSCQFEFIRSDIESLRPKLPLCFARLSAAASESYVVLYSNFDAFSMLRKFNTSYKNQRSHSQIKNGYPTFTIYMLLLLSISAKMDWNSRLIWAENFSNMSSSKNSNDAICFISGTVLAISNRLYSETA